MNEPDQRISVITIQHSSELMQSKPSHWSQRKQCKDLCPITFKFKTALIVDTDRKKSNWLKYGEWVETYTTEDTLIGLKAVIHNLLIRKSSIQAKFSEVPVCMLSLIQTLLPLF